jgi:hypothetical protein
MNDKLYISSFCSISKNQVQVNGTLYFESDINTPFPEFIKGAYKHSGMSYPKFFKMDNLSKLGIATTEFLLHYENKSDLSGNKTGIVLSNSFSSLDTDLTYQKTIANKEEYFPSPAVFVYTLPNIVIGEICIKHKIQGESIFFVTKDFDPSFLHFYVSDLFQRKDLDSILLGWIDYLDNDYLSLFCLVKQIRTSEEESSVEINFTVKDLEQFFSGKQKL